ncbi:MAG: hypothetical protein K8823_349 [Cenarchaeum symbiont of Oopsacas minuta]|nr:hypothetical protein [Cenarchaeum symbiont of Oopsacas minuta]
MIESDDASKVASTLAKNLMGVAKNTSSFERLPDSFWGYYARGHDSKGEFGIFVAYSEKKTDIDNLIETYEKWTGEKKHE